ncbi:MAG: hypothetical protein LBU14_04320, partial [Candidatus Peribacteria bacterium]|nr:hypothetical protein [Candidatus Peribacteria bacterium]
MNTNHKMSRGGGNSGCKAKKFLISLKEKNPSCSLDISPYAHILNQETTKQILSIIKRGNDTLVSRIATFS